MKRHNLQHPSTAVQVATALAIELETVYDNLPYHTIIDDEDGVVEEVDDHHLANEIWGIANMAYEIIRKLENLL